MHDRRKETETMSTTGSNTPVLPRVDRRTVIGSVVKLAGAGAAAAMLPGAEAAQPPPRTASVPTAGSGPIVVATDKGPIVETTAGKVRGYTKNGIAIFR